MGKKQTNKQPGKDNTDIGINTVFLNHHDGTDFKTRAKSSG